jgi:hypothetical protein
VNKILVNRITVKEALASFDGQKAWEMFYGTVAVVLQLCSSCDTVVF